MAATGLAVPEGPGYMEAEMEPMEEEVEPDGGGEGAGWSPLDLLKVGFFTK